MTGPLIITVSLLILLAYVFDISAAKTKIPSVILLLILGFIVKNILVSFNFDFPDLNPILPLLGTIGLILIVLEGSLELEINKSKLPLVLKSSFVAFIPLLLISFGIAFFLNQVNQVPFKLALANAIPLGIISSAIAIPSARNLVKGDKEFITYESSLSDIFGVIFFNFITLNDNIGSKTYGNFLVELLVMLIISFLSTILLAGLLSKIKHHVKFIPILVLVILIYNIAKLFHLPALIFILIFGLVIGNIDELKHLEIIKKINLFDFKKDVIKFREITTEFAFLIRALFFMLFGFIIELKDVLNLNTMLLALGITLFIFVFRYVLLKITKTNTNPLVFIAPRGLITILLFLSIPVSQQIIQIDKSLIIQIIILSAIIMMIGLMKYKEKPTDQEGLQ